MIKHNFDQVNFGQTIPCRFLLFFSLLSLSLFAKVSFFVGDYLIINCDGECVRPNNEINETWFCVDQCQSLSTPCRGKCPPNLKKNCANLCERKYQFTSYLCNNECVTKETPCQGTCPIRKVLCNGKCQERTLQCQGKCLDAYYKFANCNGTCSEYKLANWLCNSACQPSEEPCNGKCPKGKFKNYLKRSRANLSYPNLN